MTVVLRRLIVVLLVAMGIAASAASLRQLARSRTVQLFGRIVPHASVPDPVVALTFDDGPVDAIADELLDTLRSRGVRATFFVTGAELERASRAGRALVAAGHELGNHSYSHARLVFVSPATVRRELAATDSAIRAVGYTGPIHFRPPYGYKLVALPLQLSREGRLTITWDVEPDSYPAVAASAEGIVRHVLDRVRPGSIILLHPWYAARRTSREAVPMLVDSLHARGYRLATVGELLAREEKPRRASITR